jgi:hypothetical protein
MKRITSNRNFIIDEYYYNRDCQQQGDGAQYEAGQGQASAQQAITFEEVNPSVPRHKEVIDLINSRLQAPRPPMYKQILALIIINIRNSYINLISNHSESFACFIKREKLSDEPQIQYIRQITSYLFDDLNQLFAFLINDKIGEALTFCSNPENQNDDDFESGENHPR